MTFPSLATSTTMPGAACARMVSAAILSISFRLLLFTPASSGTVYFRRVLTVMKPEPAVYLPDTLAASFLLRGIPPNMACGITAAALMVFWSVHMTGLVMASKAGKPLASPNRAMITCLFLERSVMKLMFLACCTSCEGMATITVLKYLRSSSRLFKVASLLYCAAE
ncbi:hypothetical protein D3C87_1385340 [compost metagenome]